MRHSFLSLPALLCFIFMFGPVVLRAQPFQVLDTAGWIRNPPTTLLLAPAPFKTQVIFIGGWDSVLTATGAMAKSKGGNDFVAFQPIMPGVMDSGYIAINHETVRADSLIGDGGGMSILKVVRDGDSLQRVGPIRAVDFRPVGGTVANCAGISSMADGRIWTAEEAWMGTNALLNSADTGDVTLAPLGQQPGAGQVYNDIPGDFSGRTIRRHQNMNYLVEIDPAQAKAVRKQYNWGRQPFEGGVLFPDNRNVYLLPDAVPGYLGKFVADVPGDFTQGNTYVYQQGSGGGPGTWIWMDNGSLDSMLSYMTLAARKGATMLVRPEWGAYHDGKLYFSETGRDDPGGHFAIGESRGAGLAYHHIVQARQQNPALAALPDAQVVDSICYSTTWTYHDYYGRVVEFDPATETMRSFLEGGPYWTDTVSYPRVHLSNPDGLGFLHVGTQHFMIVQEDLVGITMGRVPHGEPYFSETYLLDMSIPNPSPADLLRLAVAPRGGEFTGACATPDGKTIFLCVQHPDIANPFPFNQAITVAISGWDKILAAGNGVAGTEPIQVWPNPTDQTLRLAGPMTVMLYDGMGKMVLQAQQTRVLDVSGLPEGVYVLRNLAGQSARVVVRK